MRSFQQSLFYAALALVSSQIVAQPALAAEVALPSVNQIETTPTTQQNLYSVDLATNQASLTGEYRLSNEQLDQLSRQAMEVLLVRLTGRKAILSSSRVATLLDKARYWLKSYLYVPVIEDGVKVGQKIRLQFNELELNQFLAEAKVKIWPENLRPKLLVMGTLVESNNITKLDQEALGYRVDFNLQDYAKQLALPVTWPQDSAAWVYPLEPSNNIASIQEVLIAADRDDLLSFKLVRREDGYELNWYLFSQNATVLAKGKANDANRQKLLQDMVDMVMARLVEMNRQALEVSDQVVLNLVNIGDVKSLQQAKEQLQLALPTLTEINLQSVQQNRVQLQIAFQGDYASLLDVISGLPQFGIVSSSEMLRQLDVSFEYVDPATLPPETEERNNQELQEVQENQPLKQ